MQIKPVEYYNKISKDYNTYMEEVSSNQLVRSQVMNLFKSQVNSNGTVMDFGGGTGLDLNWLSKEFSSVVFCEPSEQMRYEAVKILKNKALQNVNVLEGTDTDFNKWDECFMKSIPKLDGILSNFAVLNSIEQLDVLFAKLYEVSKPKASLCLTVLYRFPNYNISKLKDSTLSLMFDTLKQSKQIPLQYEDLQTSIYLHSLPYIKAKAKGFFEIESVVQGKQSWFKIIQLKRLE